uniref:Thioredoxin domain-containing protein n=1 Tax=Panagrellus redivivus TaxID=6233 RepID=A0A7E4VKA6_PANRE
MQTQPDVTTSIEERVAEAVIEAAFPEAISEAALDLYIRDSIEAELNPRTPKTLYSQFKTNLVSCYSFLESHMSYIIALWIVVALARYWGSSEGRLLTQVQARPVPFFPNGSVVKDYYTGNGASADELLSRAEIAVLMYYAPWSLDAQIGREPYETVARLFSDVPVVQFSAVNCFTQYGQCKRAFKLYNYPIVIAYVGKIQVHYAGPFSEAGLFTFVSQLLNPIERVSSAQQFSKLLTRYDHLVTGYFPLNNPISLKEYTTFTAAAMKSASSSDYFAQTRFISIHSHDLADHLNLDLTNRIRVITGNLSDVTRPYNLSSSLTMFLTTTSDKIIEYAKKVLDEEHTQRPRLAWIHLDSMEAGGKSENLQFVLSHGPVVLLFSTEYPGMAESLASTVVRRVADRYHSCGPAQLVSSALPAYGDVIVEGERACKQIPVSLKEIDGCCSFVAASGACSGETSKKPSENDICQNLDDAFGKEKVRQNCCGYRRQEKLLRKAFSPSSTTRNACRWFKSLKVKPAVSNESTLSVNSDIHGLGCASNETVYFYGVDRNHSEFFIRQWGVAPKSYWSKPLDEREDLLVLISTRKEVLHALEGPITTDSVAQLLKDFHASKRPPTPIQAVLKPSKTKTGLISITKLRRNEFTDFLKTKKTYDSVVFFTGSRYHGPSTTVAHTLLTVASYFADFEESIKFYKIDASTDELPFEYVFDRLPALVFFPAYKVPGVGALRYPSSLPFTVPNTFAFLVSQLNPELRWRFALSTCSPKCFTRNRRRIHTFVAHVDTELRRLRTARTHASRRADSRERATHLRGLIQRRILQRKSAVHLAKVLQMVADGKDEPDIDFLRQNMFVRWLLYNTLGQTGNFN